MTEFGLHTYFVCQHTLRRLRKDGYDYRKIDPYLMYCDKVGIKVAVQTWEKEKKKRNLANSK